MNFYKEKRIEVICEAPIADRLVEIARKHGARGFTIVPVQKGAGEAGHPRDGFLDESLGNVMLVIVANPETADRVVEKIFPTIQAHSGVITVGEVDVLRPERF